MNRYRKNASFFREAPVVIAALTERYESVMDKVLRTRESFDSEAKEVLAFRRSAPTSVQSVAAAVMLMLLTFHQMGLGAVWLGAPLMAKKEIETILDVPPGLSLICLIALGHPGEWPQKERRPVAEVMKFLY